MVEVAHEKLQAVLARRKVELHFGLTATEMDMIVIRRNGLIQGRQLRIDQQMMVAGIFRFRAGRRRSLSL